MRRFQSASEVELVPVLHMADFLRRCVLDVDVVVCVINDDFTFDDSPQIFLAFFLFCFVFDAA